MSDKKFIISSVSDTSSGHLNDHTAFRALVNWRLFTRFEKAANLAKADREVERGKGGFNCNEFGEVLINVDKYHVRFRSCFSC